MQSEGKMRNRNRWLIVISIVVFLTGLAVLLYPAYTDRLYRKGAVSYTHLTLPTN